MNIDANIIKYKKIKIRFISTNIFTDMKLYVINGIKNVNVAYNHVIISTVTYIAKPTMLCSFPHNNDDKIKHNPPNINVPKATPNISESAKSVNPN